MTVPGYLADAPASVLVEDTPIKTTARAVRVLIVLLVMSAGVICLLERLCFPTTRELREALTEAGRIEVCIYLENYEARGQVAGVLTSRGDMEELAASLRITGLWVPVDELIANCCRIRAVRDSQHTDIVVRGGRRLVWGVWSAPVSPAFMDTVVRLVEGNGGRMPSVYELVPPSMHELLNTTTNGK